MSYDRVHLRCSNSDISGREVGDNLLGGLSVTLSSHDPPRHTLDLPYAVVHVCVDDILLADTHPR